MDNKVDQNFSTVISINPYKNTFYTGNTTRISSQSRPAYAKDQYAISFLNTKSFITATIGLSKNIPDDDLPFAIENKAYEELALDMAIEYQISYIESFNVIEESNRYFHIFVVDPITLEEDFSTSVGDIKYIDQIIPVPLLLKSLYTKEIVNDNGVHVYIYFQDNDAFFTIYKDQEFVYTKSLKYSFKQMHERFSDLLGEQIPHDEFLSLISKEGLSSSNSEHQKYLIKLFGEMFLHINDVLTYAKRAFEIERIDQVYIGSQIGPISGLDEYSQTYLGLASADFNFDYGFDYANDYVDQIHLLLHLYTQQNAEDKYDCNFTVFHRPPPFAKRASGKLIMTAALATVIAMTWPAYNWTAAYFEKARLLVYESQYVELHNEKITRKATIDLKTASKEKYTNLLNEEIADFDSRKNTLEKIHTIKVDYPMKGALLTSFTKYFNKHNVKLTGLTYAEEDQKTKVFNFKLLSRTDIQITNMLKELTKKEDRKYNFSIEEINYDANRSRYQSDLKVVLK